MSVRSLIFLVFLFATLTSCENTPEKSTTTVTTPVYPESLTKVLEHHGGLDHWQAMNSLSYELVKPEGNEKQMIDLKSRAERIESTHFISGFDGEKYWVMADSTYEGDPKFYTNLMFYFYAMPFVLADPGIQYTSVEDLIFEGKRYPGIHISYEDNIGISPKDEYIIHYDPNTYEMSWLGYTVTYFNEKKEEGNSAAPSSYRWIRYNDWMEKNGIKLPQSLTWYSTKDGLPEEPKPSRKFTEIEISEEAFPRATFIVPYGANVVEE